MATKRKNRSPQKPKVKSPEAKALILSRRGGAGDRVPSGTDYKRKPKYRGMGWGE